MGPLLDKSYRKARNSESKRKESSLYIYMQHTNWIDYIYVLGHGRDHVHVTTIKAKTRYVLGGRKGKNSVILFQFTNCLNGNKKHFHCIVKLDNIYCIRYFSLLTE